MKVIDKSSVNTKARAHVLLHGLSGMGKTTFAITGGRPFVVCTEPKAESIIPLLNRDAIIAIPENIDDLREIAKALRDPVKYSMEHPKNFPGIEKATRVVFDSWTDLTVMIGNWLANGQQLQLQQYGELQKYAFGLLGQLQVGPLPSVIIARSEVQETGTGLLRVMRIVPSSLGKSVRALPGKLVATLQSVADMEGFRIESGPSDAAQRSGLPWLPHVWNDIDHGDVDRMIQVIEAGPVKAQPTEVKK